MNNNRNLVPRYQAAQYLFVKPQTLAAWASTGRYNLPFVKIGRKVFYKQEDLDQFIEHRTFTKTQ